MPLPLDAAKLVGRSLTSVFAILADQEDWDVACPRPDGSVQIWRRVETMIFSLDEPPTPPRPDTPELRALVRALESGELLVEADGGPAEGYAAILIPPGLWRQKHARRHWWLYREEDGGDRLEVLEEGRRVIETYYNPRFAKPAVQTAIYKSGAPGRPSSMHLIVAELKRCWDAGERHTKRGRDENVAEWARALVAWLNDKHPDAASVYSKSVANFIGPILRDLSKPKVP